MNWISWNQEILLMKSEQWNIFKCKRKRVSFTFDNISWTTSVMKTLLMQQKKRWTFSQSSIMWMNNWRGPVTEPCGMPLRIYIHSLITEIISNMISCIENIYPEPSNWYDPGVVNQSSPSSCWSPTLVQIVTSWRSPAAASRTGPKKSWDQWRKTTWGRKFTDIFVNFNNAAAA